MSTLFAMPGNPSGEAIYDGTTQVTGASSSQAWSDAVELAGRLGGVTIGLNNTTYFAKTYTGITSAFHTTRYYVNAASVSLPNDSNTCYLHLAFAPLSVNGSSYTALYNDLGTIKLWSRVRNDASVVVSSAFTSIPGGFESIEWIEERLYKSSGSGVADGKKEVYINGELVSLIDSQILWDVFAYTQSRFGATIGGTCTGTLEMGQIQVTDAAGPIGPLPDLSSADVLHGGGGGSRESLSSYVHIG